MSENTDQNKPLLWILDSGRNPLAGCREAFSAWADCLYIPPGSNLPNWNHPPDAIFFSAEIDGGPNGDAFTALVQDAGSIPLLAVTRLRSLAQAVAYFRAGAADYLSTPLEEEELKERFAASLERATRLAMNTVMMELEQLDAEPGSISLALSPEPDPTATSDLAQLDRQEEDDILAHLPGDSTACDADNALSDIVSSPVAPSISAASDANDKDEEDPDDTLSPATASADDDEPVAVDGLPIPSLWEELPCGLLVFDSLSNLVFSNRLGLELFGYESLAELQETLENHRDSFSPYAANHKPLADNQWPHQLAIKARAARSAVISLEKPDRRRVWLRLDCQPHLTDGKVSRLSMTLVNLTGELPPLAAAKPEMAPISPQRVKRERGKQRGRKKR